MKKYLFAGGIVVALSACVKEDKPDLFPLHYEVKASGAPKFVISYAGEDNILYLKDTLETPESGTLDWSRHLDQQPGQLYYIKVSPLPANASGVGIALRVDWKSSLLDSTSQYVQKGLTLSGYLP